MRILNRTAYWTLTMTSPAELADEFWSYLNANDHWSSLWRGRFDYLESFTDARPDAMSERQARYRSFAERSETLRSTDITPSEDATLSLLLAISLFYAREAKGHNEIVGVNGPMGYFSRLKIFLPRQSITTASDGERYLAKVTEIGRFISEFADLIRDGAPHGRVALARHIRATMKEVEDCLASDLEGFASQAPPTDMPLDERKAWSVKLKAVLETDFQPALHHYRDALADILELGYEDDKPGLCHVPGGREMYQGYLHDYTTLDMTAIEIHELGLAQIDRLANEYRTSAGPLLGTTDVEEIFNRLRTDESLHYDSTDQLVADAQTALAKAAEVAPAWFGRTPTAECVAVATTDGALAYYSTAPPDGSGPATFFFNVSDPHAWATFSLEAITYHESIPGHHFQLSHAIENPSLHPLHSQINLSAYSEGWGLYSERLADEMGLYSTEWDRIGMLYADSMRACRLVVDTGLHELGWSRQEAVDYIVANSPLTLPQIEGEVDRYIGAPGQAVSYMVGRLEIERIRADAEARLGSSFDLTEFHDLVLSQGIVTLPTLRSMVEAWMP